MVGTGWYRICVAAVAVAAVGVLGAGCGDDAGPEFDADGQPVAPDAGDTEPDRGEAFDDVVVKECVTRGAGSVAVTVEITNSSSSTADYEIDFELTDSSGATFGEGVALADDVEPGETVEVDGAAVASRESMSLECVVADVTRTPQG